MCVSPFGLYTSLKSQKKTDKCTPKQLYFTYVWGVPEKLIVMIFGTARNLANVINRTKFSIDRFNGFGLSKGQS